MSTQEEDEKDWCEQNTGEGSGFHSVLNLIRYPLGISLFLLPWAMKFGGIIAGPIMIAVFVIFNAYRSYVLTKIGEDLAEAGVSAPAGYSDWWLLENSLGGIKRTSVNCYLVLFSTLQWLSLLGHACTFLAFAGLTFFQAYPNDDWFGIKGERISIGICVAAVIVTHAATQLLRNFLNDKTCLCFDMCSGFLIILLPTIIAVFVGLPTILYYIAGVIKFNEPLHPTTAVDGYEFGLLLAGIMFVTGATPDDVTAPYGGSNNQKSFPIVILVAAIITLIILVGFGVAVFLGLELETCSSVTFNLPLGTREYMAIRVLSALAALIFVSYRHQIEPKLSNRLSTAEIACDIIFKILFLAVAGALAVGLPSFSGLACLFGSLTSFTMTLTFPFICDLIFHVTGGRSASRGPDDEGTDLIREGETTEAERQLSGVRIARDVIFIILGLAGMLYGLYTTIIHLQATGIENYIKGCAYNVANSTLTEVSF